MINLPEWRLTNKYPAFYDSESGSSIEQTAKVYAAMQELIKEYNAFTADIQNQVNNFDISNSEDYENFKKCIVTLMENYVTTIDTKIIQLEQKIAEGGGGSSEELEALAQTVASQSETIAAHTETIAALGTQMTQLAATVQALAAKYDELETSALIVDEIELEMA